MKKNSYAIAVLSLVSGLVVANVFAQSSTTNASTNIVDPTTAVTMASGAERTKEQLALRFELADLALKIDPSVKRISGQASLQFLATEPVAHIILDLDKNLPIDAIKINGLILSKDAYSNPEGKLTITLPKALAKSERVTVEIAYQGSPRIAVKAPWDGGFVWSKAPTGEPWVASAVQGEGCDLFWPCIDHPMGKPELMKIHMTVPAPLVVAGNGIAKGMEEKDGWRTYHWQTKMPSTYGIAVNVGPFAQLTGSYQSRFGNAIPLSMWHLPGNQAKAQDLFKEFAPMLDFFESRIGPYPFGFEKMGVVETPHLGMEHQTVNAYGNDYLKSQYGYDWLLQHEFAHEWFGNQLTNKNWDDLWLHEAFGTYMQPLYMRYLRGEREYQSNLQEQRSKIVNQFPIVAGRPMLEKEVSHGPGNDVYYKGSLMLHTLREMIGDEKFYKIVRLAVYGRNDPKPGNFAPRYSDTKEFIQIVNQVTKHDLNWFFKVYLYQVKLPELIVQQDGARLKLQWKTQDNVDFPMPIEIRVNEKIQRVVMHKGRGEIVLPANAYFTIDPYSKVLRHDAHLEEFKKDQFERRKAKSK